MGEYRASRGFEEEPDAHTLKKWGLNTFDIPLPTFNELYKLQLQAPMFVFQVGPIRFRSAGTHLLQPRCVGEGWGWGLEGGHRCGLVLGALTRRMPCGALPTGVLHAAVLVPG